MLKLQDLIAELRAGGTPARAQSNARFFKSGKGQYGEGDVFLGLTVPATRAIVKKYQSALTLRDVEIILASSYHEERLAGVFMLVHFAKKHIYPIPQLAEFYLARADRINNWDLVDASSEYIMGPYLEEYPDSKRKQKLIDECIASKSLWVNRIAIMASFYQIKKGSAELTFYIAGRFLDHRHDLIQKATGWMLREVGKRIDERLLCEFLDKYAARMPRTMLRYAIERLPEEKRKAYLKR